VDWGGPASVQTDLDGSKRFFRARSWIRYFFELNNAEAGDTVLVKETGPYSYSVRLRKEGRA
jgi:ribosomal protein S17